MEVCSASSMCTAVVIWSLVRRRYILIVLMADDHGEGTCHSHAPFPLPCHCVNNSVQGSLHLAIHPVQTWTHAEQVPSAQHTHDDIIRCPASAKLSCDCGFW